MAQLSDYPRQYFLWLLETLSVLLVCLVAPFIHFVLSTALVLLFSWPLQRARAGPTFDLEEDRKTRRFSARSQLCTSLHLPPVINIHNNRCAAKVVTEKVFL